MKTSNANKISLLDRAYRVATNTQKFFNNGVGDKVYLESLFAQVDNIPSPTEVEIYFNKPLKYFGFDDSVNASFSLDMSDKQMIAGHFATISKQVAHNIGIYSLMCRRDTWLPTTRTQRDTEFRLQLSESTPSPQPGQCAIES